MTGSSVNQEYKSLLHSPHNKRKVLTASSGAKSKSGSKDGKRSGSPLKAISKQSAPKPAAARQLELSPTRKPDVKYGLKSPRYFTSPENEDIDFKKSSRRDGASSKESPITRQLAVDKMIIAHQGSYKSKKSPTKGPKKKEAPRDRELEVPRDRDLEKQWEARKNKALLNASEIELGLLKEVLFSQTIDRPSPALKVGPVYKEVITSTPNQSLLSTDIHSLNLHRLNDLTLSDNNSEIENNYVKSPREDTTLSKVEKKDMSSSYREDDFQSIYRTREDKSINTSPEPRKSVTPPQDDTSGRRSVTPSGSRPSSPAKSSKRDRSKPRHSEDTLDTISDLESRLLCASPSKKVSFSENTGERNLRFSRMERDIQQKDAELSEMKYATLQLKQKLGESEGLRIALESDKLRLSLHNITNSPRNPSHNLTTATHAVMSSQQPVHVMSQDQPQETALPQESKVPIGVNLSNAYSDITEVNSMIHQMKLENESLKTSLNTSAMNTKHQTKLLEEKLHNVEVEKDRICDENRKFQRLIALDDRGSRIALLQRDLQNQIAENEKLKNHLQLLRENYTKNFGASI